MNPLDYSVWDILQELVYEGHCELYANLRKFRKKLTQQEALLLQRAQRIRRFSWCTL